MYVNNLPRVALDSGEARIRTSRPIDRKSSDLTTRPPSHTITNGIIIKLKYILPLYVETKAAVINSIAIRPPFDSHSTAIRQRYADLTTDLQLLWTAALRPK